MVISLNIMVEFPDEQNPGNVFDTIVEHLKPMMDYNGMSLVQVESVGCMPSRTRTIHLWTLADLTPEAGAEIASQNDATKDVHAVRIPIEGVESSEEIIQLHQRVMENMGVDPETYSQDNVILIYDTRPSDSFETTAVSILEYPTPTLVGRLSREGMSVSSLFPVPTLRAYMESLKAKLREETISNVDVH